jgi:hypothetical protein
MYCQTFAKLKKNVKQHVRADSILVMVKDKRTVDTVRSYLVEGRVRTRRGRNKLVISSAMQPRVSRSNPSLLPCV